MPLPLSVSTETEHLFRLTVSGDLSDERLITLSHSLETARAALEQHYASTGQKASILMDLSAFSGIYGPEVVEAMTVFAKGNAAYVAKTAVFGGPQKSAILAEVIAALANRDNIKLFADEVAARAWLDEFSSPLAQ